MTNTIRACLIAILTHDGNQVLGDVLGHPLVGDPGPREPATRNLVFPQLFYVVLKGGKLGKNPKSLG
ncbi:MAG: hypothetical protein GY699_03810 [Desulfobacteraceae bacterium]|nr:hypothetical protein [Desulfobacteraceae bacterium]